MKGALAALLLLPLTLTGTTLAAPIDVLEISSARTVWRGTLGDAEILRYEFHHSVYQVMVSEELWRDQGGLRVLRARSSDIRAVEYFRWDGRIRLVDDLYVQDAPADAFPELTIRVTTEGAQRFVAPRWSLGLRQVFGEGVVHVRPAVVPLLTTVLP